MMNDLPDAGPIENKDYYAVMVHFYRGELGRIMIWRQRLDVSTNWAIVATTASVTFGLGDPANSSLIFLIANYIIMLLLFIESRRYRYYDAFRARVRMLEAHFIMPVMMRETKLLQGDWKKVMSEDLLLPSFKMSRFTSLVRRFQRNYFWIFAILNGAWALKIWLHIPASHSPLDFWHAFLFNHGLHPVLYFLLIGILMIFLTIMTMHAIFQKQRSGEFARKAMRGQKWMQ